MHGNLGNKYRSYSASHQQDKYFQHKGQTGIGSKKNYVARGEEEKESTCIHMEIKINQKIGLFFRKYMDLNVRL